MTAHEQPHSPAPITTRLIFAQATMRAFEKAPQRRAARRAGSGPSPASAPASSAHPGSLHRRGRAWWPPILVMIAVAAAWLLLA